MTRPRTAQEIIHWLEVGAGARWVRLGAMLGGMLALSLLVAWKQFRGPLSETTLIQADMGRQLVRGAGFSTLVNYPQTAAVLKARGVAFDPARAYPELHHAPLYPLMIAGGLRLIPEARRNAMFLSAPVPPEGYGGDYFLLGLNVVLLWLTTWLTYDLGRRLFEPRVGWLAALGLLLSVSIWEATVAVNGTPLMMLLILVAFSCWHRIEVNAGDEGEPRVAWGWVGALGISCGLLFLTEYSSGALVVVALAYGGLRFRGRAAAVAVAGITLGFAVVAGPWVVRNIALTGHPVALAGQNVALKFGDPTAEPATVRGTLSAEVPRIDLKKLGNKTLTALQENLKTRIWSGGAMWFAAFFVAGLLYAFRSAVANRLRWVLAASLVVLLFAQAALNSGETERHVAVWLAPLLIIFGAGFFFVLVGSNAVLSPWPRAVATVLLLAQALPLVHDALEPRRFHFHYPPYFPALFQAMRAGFEQRAAPGTFGLMADVPAGLAWYGQTRAWAQPPRLRDFYAVTLEQPIGVLLLTPRTLDRPFFSELNARRMVPGALGAAANRYGEWGEVYAGLLTGALPREFPLRTPEKWSENLYLLLNPALPPVRGK